MGSVFSTPKDNTTSNAVEAGTKEYVPTTGSIEETSDFTMTMDGTSEVEGLVSTVRPREQAMTGGARVMYDVSPYAQYIRNYDMKYHNVQDGGFFDLGGLFGSKQAEEPAKAAEEPAVAEEPVVAQPVAQPSVQPSAQPAKESPGNFVDTEDVNAIIDRVKKLTGGATNDAAEDDEDDEGDEGEAGEAKTEELLAKLGDLMNKDVDNANQTGGAVGNNAHDDMLAINSLLTGGAAEDSEIFSATSDVDVEQMQQMQGGSFNPMLLQHLYNAEDDSDSSSSDDINMDGVVLVNDKYNDNSDDSSSSSDGVSLKMSASPFEQLMMKNMNDSSDSDSSDSDSVDIEFEDSNIGEGMIKISDSSDSDSITLSDYKKLERSMRNNYALMMGGAAEDVANVQNSSQNYVNAKPFYSSISDMSDMSAVHQSHLRSYARASKY